MIKRLKTEWSEMSSSVKLYGVGSLAPLILSIAVFETASSSTINTQFVQLVQLIGYTCGLSLLLMFMIMFYYASILDKFDKLEKQIVERKQ